MNAEYILILTMMATVGTKIKFGCSGEKWSEKHIGVMHQVQQTPPGRAKTVMNNT